MKIKVEIVIPITVEVEKDDKQQVMKAAKEWSDKMISFLPKEMTDMLTDFGFEKSEPN